MEMRLKKSGNRHKTHRSKACVRVESLRRMFLCKTAFFQLRVEISTLVVLVTVFSIAG